MAAGSNPAWHSMTIFRIAVTSTSDPYVLHTVTVDTENKTVACNCKAGRIVGRCKHIRFYKSLIRALLHESPGFEREKGGK